MAAAELGFCCPAVDGYSAGVNLAAGSWRREFGCFRDQSFLVKHCDFNCTVCGSVDFLNDFIRFRPSWWNFPADFNPWGHCGGAFWKSMRRNGLNAGKISDQLRDLFNGGLLCLHWESSVYGNFFDY